jgi:hypothetical protein
VTTLRARQSRIRGSIPGRNKYFSTYPNHPNQQWGPPRHPMSAEGCFHCLILQDILFSTYALQPSRLIVRFGLDVPTFATRRLHACHHARAPSGGRWNCGREMSDNFSLNSDFHVTFRGLLHAVKLRHGTDGFTSLRRKAR